MTRTLQRIQSLLPSTVVCAVLLLCGPVLGQLVVLPSAGNMLGAATASEPGKWIVFAEGFMPVQPTLVDGGKSILWEGKAGTYAVIYLPPGDGQPTVQRVTLGDPGPDPPEPDPPGPNPVGPKQIMMFYDSDRLDNYPEPQRALLTSLALRRELVQAGHVVLEMVEAAALAGTPPARYKAFFDAARGQAMPVLAMAPKSGGSVRAVPLPADKAGLLEALK